MWSKVILLLLKHYGYHEDILHACEKYLMCWLVY